MFNVYKKSRHIKMKCEIDGKINPFFVLLNVVLKSLNFWWRRTESFIRKFNLTIKKCYAIVWDVEKILKVKTFEL